MICASLLGTLSKFARFLIDFGMVYVAEAPIYEQGGKYYFTSDQDENGNIPGFNQSKSYTRFKGLNTSPLTQ